MIRADKILRQMLFIRFDTADLDRAAGVYAGLHTAVISPTNSRKIFHLYHKLTYERKRAYENR